jgi:signal transduction histidine kinase/ActR/RegA family two-component response regulator
MAVTQSAHNLSVIFPGTGGMAAAMRAHDWSGSPLGPPAAWPQELKTVVAMMLAADHQIALFWGAAYCALYNDAYAPTIGNKHPAALGEPARAHWSELWDDLEPLLDEVRDAGRTVSARDRPFYMERHGYPETVYFDISYSPIRDENGAVAGVLCIVNETTARINAEAARKQAEARLRASEERQAFLLKLSDALRPIEQPEAIQHQAARLLGEYIGANRVGYAENRADDEAFDVTQNYVSGVPDLRGRCRYGDYGVELIAAMRDGQTVAYADITVEPALTAAEKNAHRVLDARASVSVPLVKNGRLRAILFVHFEQAHDWTREELSLFEDVAERAWAAVERARAEAALREREAQLREADRAKDAFLAMLGHELRNPLQPIKTALHVMHLRDANLFERERAMIDNQLRHMVGMVDDLLDVSRIARGKVELRTAPVAIGGIIARSIETAAPLLEQHRQTIETNIGDDPAVEGDARRLIQVVTNLLTNAAKYSPPGRTVRIGVTADEAEAVIRVGDEGFGIDAELLPRIFDSFIQAAQPIARSRGGLGLGLAITRNLVRMHGGSIEAKSEGHDRGSEFIVRLPLARSGQKTPLPNRPAETRAAASSDGLAKTRVLIVDDYAGAADSLSDFLELSGFETRIARDGPEAIEAAADFYPAVALIDIGLPVMNGYDVARHLRAMPEIGRPRLIAITGYGQERDRERATAAGFDEHLAKPVDPERISALIRNKAQDSVQ